MTLDTTTREYQRLLEVAREYRQRGYEVLISPSVDQLPEFLAPYRVDMFARSTDENVIVEVRTQESLKDRPELDAIAQALQDKSSWRFELVVTNPKDRSSLQFKDATSLDYVDITYRLREARQLSDQEHGEAALLLAWSATEALLRYIADEEAIPIAKSNPNQLLKSLFMYGLLDKEQYQTLQTGLQARNTAVHGYKEQGPLANALNDLLQVADQLMNRHVSS
jgi:REase_AHJR-like protein